MRGHVRQKFAFPGIFSPSSPRIQLCKDAGTGPAHAKMHARTGFHCRHIQQKPSPGRPPGCLLRQSLKKQTRVQLYLPIADIPVNVFLILAMGAAVGFVSGMFGIGGGFLMTPLLIFVGIAPAVAVATVTSHIAASSFSGALSYWRKRAVDPMLALVLLSGGIIGTIFGVWTFTRLRSLGQLDLLIALSYVVLLSGVGAAMSWEGLRAMLRSRKGGTIPLRRSGGHGWVH